MKLSIGAIIYQAVNEQKWLDINYDSKDGKFSRFWFALKDIDFDKDKLYGDIFNYYKSAECIENPRPISRHKIKSVKLVEGSIYDPPQALIDKIEQNKEKIDWLDVDTFDNNILLYLSECYKYDNDPFIDDAVMIPGIDYSELVKAGTYQLSQEQFQKMLDAVLMMNPFDAEKSLRHRTLAFNIYSIDIFGKQYVVAYRDLQLDFKHKTLRIAAKSSINNSFLIEEKRYTLGSYLTIDPNDFCENFDQNITQYVALMEENYKDGERSDTRPSIFLLQRSIQTGLEEAFNAIYLMSREKKLSQPVKAFFGANNARSGTSKEPYIVVFDKKKTNIDQICVVYNSMVNHITYVQGPPGTGKTETIFNVLLSAYANGKKCIVCSNNNNPIENIFAKMTSSFRKKVFNSTEYEEIFFPIIRVGNIEENKKTILKLRSILNFLDKKANLFVDENRTAISKESALSQYDALKGMLKEYEDRQDVSSIIAMLESWKTINKNKTILSEIEKQIDKQREKLANLIDISDEDVANNVVSSEDSFKFMNYLYYSSIETLRRIENKTYKELRDIILTEDVDEAGRLLVKYLKEDENVRRFIGLFPFVVVTNLSAAKLGSPKQHFDLCIMDESGQCNMATALIPIVRATDLLLVGDTNQLQPVTVLEKELNEKLIRKYAVSPQYNYINNSILKVMQLKDNNSKRIFLRYHYRCGQKIADFANNRFYDGKLILKNNLPGELRYIDVKNVYDANNRNAYVAEARAIAKTIIEGKYTDVGIVTPFVNQARLINRALRKYGITDVTAGTVHSLQGAERSTIIMSSAISLRTAKKTMKWLENNHELINVGITRAKNTFIFVGDKLAIDALSQDNTSDLKSLSDYVHSNGEIKVIPSDVTIITDFSNDSRAEKDFFETISPYFQSRYNKYDVTRNVPVKEAIKAISEEDLSLIGNKEFDVLIRVKPPLSRTFKPIIVFEIDGGEHVGQSKVAKRDREKELVCKKYGIKLIRISNNKVKDYELIISMFEVLCGETEDLKISLFDYGLESADN